MNLLTGASLLALAKSIYYYISQTSDQQRFEARKIVFSWECLNLFATGCSSSRFQRSCIYRTSYIALNPSAFAFCVYIMDTQSNVTFAAELESQLGQIRLPIDEV